MGRERNGGRTEDCYFIALNIRNAIVYRCWIITKTGNLDFWPADTRWYFRRGFFLFGAFTGF